ncbi:hypothetical protein AVM47_033700 [Pseudomonas aeruginosa]|jgi:hypothetical protein|uniref:hypothetical protein n=1 Tax=Pseudomonas aeruginosa TaxID=287 RepID=UPI00076CD3F8|nr:hypothetical protein [Pseudomonas aeruginosa]MBK1802857.1 hypothetical protein [Pseudomonas aeruginosa]MBM2530473.1 hypothetical protein [Pseudomonas aeruginosa]MCA6854760.1 hypothetical protein [Pseudomonas aeruginosa]HCI1729315.1 hypothetical protein [Pseudomonas aeruginosa]HCI1799717.1 hypothetical protein [Pseudomonas aeruginosa]
MSGTVQRVVVTHGVERVVTVRQAGRVLEVRQLLSPRVTVVSAGVQGPVGALAENVLQRTLQAEADARQALALASDANATLGALLEDLQGAFDYHAGAISAQGG